MYLSVELQEKLEFKIKSGFKIFLIYNLNSVSYREIGDANFKCALWIKNDLSAQLAHVHQCDGCSHCGGSP